MQRTACAAFFVLVTLAVIGTVATRVSAQPHGAGAAAASVQPAKPTGQGIAVLAVGSSREGRDHAFSLARAIYGSRLRPTSLDEISARMLAGDALPPNASRQLRELYEVRAAVTGDDAASRRLLTGLAQQVGAQALLVVTVLAGAPPPIAADADSDADAGTGNAMAPAAVVARLFLVDSGEFDAARYSPESGASRAAEWKSTATSLEGRFPQPTRTLGPDAATRPAMTTLNLPTSEERKSRPFYASGWFWGAMAGAALIGGIFYFASRDKSDDPIHLQMRVPR